MKRSQKEAQEKVRNGIKNREKEIGITPDILLNVW